MSEVRAEPTEQEILQALVNEMNGCEKALAEARQYRLADVVSRGLRTIVVQANVIDQMRKEKANGSEAGEVSDGDADGDNNLDDETRHHTAGE